MKIIKWILIWLLMVSAGYAALIAFSYTPDAITALYGVNTN